MLQKTLLNIEGLGRDLDPDLDLWKTAKPYLERWMNEQVGWRALYANLKRELPGWAGMLPQLPRLVHQQLAGDRLGEIEKTLRRLGAESRRRNRWLAGITILMLITLALQAAGYFLY